MPELVLEIGGSVFEVACEVGQEASLHRAARLLHDEAVRIEDAIGRSTEKRMLLLSGLMLADSMAGLEDRLRNTEERLAQAEDRLRATEAKAAMLAANALRLETENSSRTPAPEVERLKGEHAAASALLAKVAGQIEALAAELEG
jgi:cell division protein ZapA